MKIIRKITSNDDLYDIVKCLDESMDEILLEKPSCEIMGTGENLEDMLWCHIMFGGGRHRLECEKFSETDSELAKHFIEFKAFKMGNLCKSDLFGYLDSENKNYVLYRSMSNTEISEDECVENILKYRDDDKLQEFNIAIVSHNYDDVSGVIDKVCKKYGRSLNLHNVANTLDSNKSITTKGVVVTGVPIGFVWINSNESVPRDISDFNYIILKEGMNEHETQG